MYKAEVYVTFKKGVLDPQGETVGRSLNSMGFAGIEEVRIGRFIEMKIDAPDQEAAALMVEEACQQLLANPVLEDFRVHITSHDDGGEKGE